MSSCTRGGVRKIMGRRAKQRSSQFILLDVAQDLSGEFGRARRVVYFSNASMLVDEHGDAPCALGLVMVCSTIVHRHAIAHIREKWESKVVLGGKAGIRCYGVVAAPQYRHVLGIELRMQACKRPPFRRSSTGACPWVEPQNDFAAGVVFERDGRACMRRCGEVGRWIAHLEAARGRRECHNDERRQGHPQMRVALSRVQSALRRDAAAVEFPAGECVKIHCRIRMATRPVQQKVRAGTLARKDSLCPDPQAQALRRTLTLDRTQIGSTMCARHTAAAWLERTRWSALALSACADLPAASSARLASAACSRIASSRSFMRSRTRA